MEGQVSKAALIQEKIVAYPFVLVLADALLLAVGSGMVEEHFIEEVGMS